MPAAKGLSDGRPMRDNFSYRISVIHALLGRHTTGIYASRQLTSHQWKVLSVLFSWPPMPAARITELVTLDKAAISRAVAGLIKRGLADRKLRPASGVIHVVLTAAGAGTYRAMLREMHKLQKELFKNLKKPDRTMLFDILDKIEVVLRATTDPSPVRPKKRHVSGKASRGAGKVERAR